MDNRGGKKVRTGPDERRLSSTVHGWDQYHRSASPPPTAVPCGLRFVGDGLEWYRDDHARVRQG